MVGEVQHQRLTFDSFPYKGWLIGSFVRTYTTTRVTSCVTTTSHAPCYYTHFYAAPLMLPHPSIINSCAQLYHCPAACFDQSLGFLNPTICRLSNIATKSDKNFVSRFLSYCFVTKWDLWEQVDLLILFMKSEETRHRRSWRPRISWTGRKSSKFEFNLLSSIREALKK